MSDLFANLLDELDAEFRPGAEKAAGQNLAGGRLVRIVPEKTLPVSVTGTACKQNCAHCNGHYLKGMIPIERLSQFDLNEYDSVLISGGGMASGEVDLSSHADLLLGLPEHLTLNLHPGFQPVEKLLFLKARKVIVSYDLPASDKVISQVFRLPYKINDYEQLFLNFSQHFTTVPHINLGLDSQECEAETRVIDFLRNHEPEQLVFIIFRPTPGTDMGNVTPPDPLKAVQLIVNANNSLSSAIKIGCMRPSGDYRRNFDILAWLHGIENFVQPDRTLLKILQEHGVEIENKSRCCAI